MDKAGNLNRLAGKTRTKNYEMRTRMDKAGNLNRLAGKCLGRAQSSTGPADSLAGEGVDDFEASSSGPDDARRPSAHDLAAAYRTLIVGAYAELWDLMQHKILTETERTLIASARGWGKTARVFAGFCEMVGGEAGQAMWKLYTDGVYGVDVGAHSELSKDED